MENNNIVTQELVDATFNKVEEAAKDLNDKIVETGLQAVKEVPVTATISQPKKNYTGINIGVGAGLILGGGLLGYAADRWVIPYFSADAKAERKAKRAEKKAAKEAKKAEKKGKTKKSEPKPAEAAKKEAPKATEEEGVDPRTIDTTID